MSKDKNQITVGINREIIDTETTVLPSFTSSDMCRWIMQPALMWCC